MVSERLGGASIPVTNHDADFLLTDAASGGFSPSGVHLSLSPEVTMAGERAAAGLGGGFSRPGWECPQFWGLVLLARAR